MFKPNTTNQKFKKKFLISNNGYNLKLNELKIGDFGVKALGPGLLYPHQLEAVRKFLKKQLKIYNSNSQIWFNIFPHFSYTKKPIEVRMGKGKGNITDWYSSIKIGTVLYEIKGLKKADAYKILKQSLVKLPFKGRVISKIN